MKQVIGKYTNVRGSESEGKTDTFARIYDEYVILVPRKPRNSTFALCFVRFLCFLLRRNRNYLRQNLKKLRRNIENVGDIFSKAQS